MTSHADDKNYCQHCWPLAQKHIENKINSVLDFYLGAFFRILFAIPFVKKIFQITGHWIKTAVLRFALLIKHAKLQQSLNRSKMDNCILQFWDEAHRRGMKIWNVEISGVQTQIFCFEHNGRNYFFDRNPIYPKIHNRWRYKDATQYDDKIVFKKFLQAHQFPCPAGSAFISVQRALSYGVKLGFPLVVKPLRASTSIHVSTNIKNEKQLLQAILLAKEVNYQVIVEQYIPGAVYRAIVLNHELIACAKREAGKIVGNGKDTVEKLIDEHNRHPWRGAPDQLDCTLHKVEKNKNLIKFLAQQNVKLTTKLVKNQIIQLSAKMNVGHGGDVTNVTSAIHPENIALLQKLSRAMNIPLLGLDFICVDVSMPWHQQSFGILENNSLPGIGIHHFPSSGEPINVAGFIWDFVLQ